VMPVIIGATETTSKSQYLSNIPGKREIKKTTENSHTGHCTNTSQSTNVKYAQNIQMENSITRAMNCEYRIAIPYILGTWSVSGM